MEPATSFSGGAVNAVDAKGRVSLPSTFRAVIERRLKRADALPEDEQRAIYLKVHIGHRCLTGYDPVRRQEMETDIAEQVSDLRGIARAEAEEELAGDILGGERLVGYDGAGRMILPQSLRDEARIGDLAYFLTAGRSFQIWSPAEYRAAYEDKPGRVRDMEGLIADRGGRA